MVGSMFLANDSLEIQVAESEFKSAENLMMTIENEVHEIIFKPGSSRVIKTSFSTVAPGYSENGDMNVSVGEVSQYSIKIKSFNIDGRQIMSGAPEYYTKGSQSLIITPNNATLGKILVSKPRNMRVSLDYEQVLCTYTGIVDMFNGTDYVPHNTLELTSVVLDFGEVSSGENSIIVIENKRVASDSFVLTGDFNIDVTTTGGSESITLDQLGGNPAYSTYVNFNRVYVTISVIGGN
jgi:hypothetical protein